MSNSTAPTMRKIGGGLKGKRRDKKKSESVMPTVPLQIGDNKVRGTRTLGGGYKIRPLRLKEGNLLDPSTGKYSKVTITKVIENLANREYARRNIITKGSVVETSMGKAAVTNRPGQTGQITLKKVKE